MTHRLAGIPPTAAARLVGFTNPRESARDMERRPDIKGAIQKEVAAQRRESKWDREAVLETLEDAMELAKIISDPSAMIRGVQEINKMQGHYAPETKHIQVTGDRAQQLDQISNMSEADLLERLGKDEAYIDAEFEVVSSEPCEVSSEPCEVPNDET